MTSDQTPWRRWQAVALGGLLVLAVLSGAISVGVWLALLVGLPSGLGWLAGAIVGYLWARAIMRQLVERLMA